MEKAYFLEYKYNEMLRFMQWFMTCKRWFAGSLVLLLVALLFTAVVASGLLTYPTLYVEQRLLLRPVTGVDCVLREWVTVLQVSFFLIITLLVGIVCLLLGYRWRVLPYLVLLLLLGVGIEVISKQLFAQPVPRQVSYGLFSLQCPQLEHQSPLVRWSVAVGMWWKIPPMAYWDKQMLILGAADPLVLSKNVEVDYSYPSGHALRCAFLGMVVFWLCQRHIRRRWLRLILLPLLGIFAFSGGLVQFYIGNHLITDALAGYLFGLSAACCAIGVLQQNQKRRTLPLQGESQMPYNSVIKTP